MGPVRPAQPAETVDTRIAFETPERVRFRHQVAGPARRAVALALDVLLQGLCVAALGLVLVGLSVLGEAAGRAGVGLVLAAFFVVSWLYGAGFEGLWGGRTPGKAALSMRVVRRDGGRIGMREALLRNLLRGADGLPVGYVVGGVAAMLDPAARRLGDHVAGTIVVHEVASEAITPVVLDPPISEAERQDLPHGVELRGPERRVIEALLRRRVRLGVARTEELATPLAERVGARAGVHAATATRVIELAWARATGRER